MTPRKFRPTMNRFDIWSRAAMCAFALGAATPLLPARAEPGAHDGEDDRRARGGTTLSIPLSGTGVEASATPSVPRPGPPSTPVTASVKNAGATTGSANDTGDRASGAAHEQRSDVKDK